MTRDELVRFLRRYKLAVQASLTPGGAPQAANVGFAVSDELEIVFDTVESTRKYKNLRADPRIALVIGWEDAITTQIEGIADFPEGAELERIREWYFGAYPDGRDRLACPGITFACDRTGCATATSRRTQPLSSSSPATSSADACRARPDRSGNMTCLSRVISGCRPSRAPSRRPCNPRQH